MSNNIAEVKTTVQEILTQIKAIAGENASTILFTVGIAMVAFVYVAKYVALPGTREINTSEFIFSVSLAVLLLLGGAALRILQRYMEIRQSIHAAELLTRGSSKQEKGGL